MTVAGIDLGIVLPAFLAGLLVVSTHVPLGERVLARGIVFIDLAIAQVAGLGVTAAAALGWETEGWRVQVAACLAALLSALLLTWTEKRWPEAQEALIGVLFVVAASVELLVLANNPHGGEHLKDLLVGQILWVSPRALAPATVLYAGVLVVWLFARRWLGGVGFYVLFALTVTQSVQLVGVYLVFASLILPALSMRRLPPRRRLVAGYSIGVSGYAAGLLASMAFDLPAGPLIVVALLLAFIATTALSALAPRDASASEVSDAPS